MFIGFGNKSSRLRTDHYTLAGLQPMGGMKHPLTPPPINQPNTSPPLDDSGATHGEHYCDHEQMFTHSGITHVL